MMVQLLGLICWHETVSLFARRMADGLFWLVGLQSFFVHAPSQHRTLGHRGHAYAEEATYVL